MLTKYIFETECEHLSEKKQHILFSVLSDSLIDKGCSSISNIRFEEKFISPLKYIEVLCGTEIDKKAIQCCIQQFVNIRNIDQLFLNGNINWVEEYRNNTKPIKVLERFLICPDWHKPEQLFDDLIVIRINPGLAFGTGLHSTTQLCLQYVSELNFNGKNILDVGCGTGIIGIACLKTNAKKVIFVDNDLSALNVTRENLKKNKCEDNHLLCSSISKVPEKADYIFANILLNPLKKMSKTIVNRLKKGGKIYLSGILIGQVSELLASYVNASDGMIVKVSEKKLKQWICVELSFK